ncbi:MAG: aminotransferase class I/II-fold pyridoxal phosphate-dependent enzyme [Thermoanaerobacteraceae bacterium]|nr:aminotransferase class I/II-fold pyridoxal phosphate-dependent enzyme [Thermoanaerobacteraceae bacterium]
MPLVEALKRYGQSVPVRFHMPGHKGRQLAHVIKDLELNLYNWDVTEIPGLDDLHQPSGPIKKAQEKLARLYGADESFFLVNGASSGVIAMVGANAKPGDEILISRASHKSVLSALILTGTKPVYVMPEKDENLGVYTQVASEAVAEALRQNPDVRAVFLTSPVYQGFCPDFKLISEIVCSKSKILLVDEAQGPHFGLNLSLPKSAGEFADAWVQSPHKMLTSLTQSAWLHVKGDRISKKHLKSFLKLVTTTSPSYILMASLDMARGIMEAEGKVLTDRALELADIARRYINKYTPFYAVGAEMRGKNGIYDIDLSRLMVNVSGAGYTGYEMERLLRRDFNIYAEYADLYNIYFLVTFSNSKSDVDGLVKALSTLKTKAKLSNSIIWPDKLPKAVMEPRTAFYALGEHLPLEQSIGRIIKDALVPYPPGIPLLMPGEVVEQEHIQVLSRLLKSGGHCHGVTSEGFVQVVAEL